MPVRPGDVLKVGHGPQFFTAIDLSQSFFQVLNDPEATKQFRMMTHDCVYEWLRLPMGFKNSPSIFARAIDKVMSDLPKQAGESPFHKVFIDDLIIYSQDWQSHLRHITTIMDRLRDAGLKIRFKKSNFAFDSLTYLGHRVDRTGIHTDPDKVKAICRMAPPKTPQAIRSWLAMAGYFRGHVKGFAEATVPLKERETTEGSRKPWTQAQLEAFENLKKSLTEAPCLRRPRFDQPFLVTVDWSKHAVGAVLSQIDPETGHEHPIRFASRLCSGPESRLSPTQGELLACIYALEKFKPYIYHRPFTLVTDHSALLALMSPSLKDPKLCRWATRLDEFGEFDIRHRKGTLNVAADCLSRQEMTGIEPAHSHINALVLCDDDGEMGAETLPSTVCPITDQQTARQIDKHPCKICGHAKGNDEMIICESCNEPFHRACLNPHSFRPKQGAFYCPTCDPTHATTLEAYFEQDTTLSYHHGDPYRDQELWAYLADPTRANQASAVAKRAKRVRFHPTLDGFLQLRKRTGPNCHTWLTCPPKEYRRAILVEAHEACGHGGRRLTLQHLKQTYIWPGATRDIKSCVRSCHSCQVHKAAMPVPAPA